MAGFPCGSSLCFRRRHPCAASHVPAITDAQGFRVGCKETAVQTTDRIFSIMSLFCQDTTWFAYSRNISDAGESFSDQDKSISETLCLHGFHCLHLYLVKFSFYFQGDANSVQVSVQLKLSNKVKNLFEYCELHLPFFHRFVLIFNYAD